MKIRTIYVSKKRCKEKHVDLLLIGEGEQKLFLSMISIDSCMIFITLRTKTFLSLMFTCFHAFIKASF